MQYLVFNFRSQSTNFDNVYSNQEMKKNNDKKHINYTISLE